MAAHNFFFQIESNLQYTGTRFITLAVVPKRGNEWQGPTPRDNAVPKKRRCGGKPLATACPI